MHLGVVRALGTAVLALLASCATQVAQVVAFLQSLTSTEAWGAAAVPK